MKEDAKLRAVCEGVDVGEDGIRDRNIVRLQKVHNKIRNVLTSPWGFKTVLIDFDGVKL